MRGQVEERLAEEILDANQKQLETIRRRLELQVEERAQEIQARYAREFE